MTEPEEATEPTPVHDDQLYDIRRDLHTIKNIVLTWAILTGIGAIVIIASAMEQQSTSPFP